jgi:hypothetical protein
VANERRMWTSPTRVGNNRRAHECARPARLKGQE